MDSRRRANLPRVAACLALVAVLAPGCASWHSIGRDAPAAYVAREKPDIVRFSLRDSILVLSRPTVRGDSVVGLCKSVEPHQWAGVRGDEIRGMEIHTTRGTKGTKIAALSITTLLVSFAVLALVAGDPKIY